VLVQACVRALVFSYACMFVCAWPCVCVCVCVCLCVHVKLGIMRPLGKNINYWTAVVEPTLPVTSTLILVPSEIKSEECCGDQSPREHTMYHESHN